MRDAAPDAALPGWLRAVALAGLCWLTAAPAQAENPAAPPVCAAVDRECVLALARHYAPAVDVTSDMGEAVEMAKFWARAGDEARLQAMIAQRQGANSSLQMAARYASADLAGLLAQTRLANAVTERSDLTGLLASGDGMAVEWLVTMRNLAKDGQCGAVAWAAGWMADAELPASFPADDAYATATYHAAECALAMKDAALARNLAQDLSDHVGQAELRLDDLQPQINAILLANEIDGGDAAKRRYDELLLRLDKALAAATQTDRQAFLDGSQFSAILALLGQINYPEPRILDQKLAAWTGQPVPDTARRRMLNGISYSAAGHYETALALLDAPELNLPLSPFMIENLRIRAGAMTEGASLMNVLGDAPADEAQLGDWIMLARAFDATGHRAEVARLLDGVTRYAQSERFAAASGLGLAQLRLLAEASGGHAPLVSALDDFAGAPIPGIDTQSFWCSYLIESGQSARIPAELAKTPLANEIFGCLQQLYEATGPLGNR